jgi:CRP/FNR family transcriptional regulator
MYNKNKKNVKEDLIVDFKEKFSDVFETLLIEILLSKGILQQVEPETVIVEYGQKIVYMPIIIKGLVRVLRNDENGKELFLYYVGDKESCAMTFTCCMQEAESEIRAIAEEHTKILKIPITLMDELLIKFPSWKSFVMKTIKMRFNELLKAIDSLAFMKLDERLIQFLKEKSERTGSKVIHLSHEQIANELATSRVVISRLLKKMENEGMLLTYRNQVKLLGNW